MGEEREPPSRMNLRLEGLHSTTLLDILGDTDSTDTAHTTDF